MFLLVFGTFFNNETIILDEERKHKENSRILYGKPKCGYGTIGISDFVGKGVFMEIKNRFGEYMTRLRKENDISLEQLSDGLCDFSTISRVERGEREPDKLLQNRILTRLGAVPENYENFLYYDDYCRWEKRQGIIHYILEENMTEAKRLLNLYSLKYDMKEALEQQFYLAMLAQIRRYEGAGVQELAGYFEEALQLTVPEIDTRSFRTRALSLEELNLLLEYRYCKNQGVSLQFYETLLDYIERMERTLLAKAKIYPKTVYYYYESWKISSEKTKIDARHLLQLCDEAIELLRNANRMFYLWELFCMKEELTPALPTEIQQEEAWQSSLQECRDWRITLEELYREYGVTIAMYEFCYLYVESENYCIGDVVRIRRKMLGMSQEKLCHGICDVRTLSRLEQNQKNTHKEIVQELFDRLNLSTELCRTELVTNNQEAIEKYRELRVLNNKKDYQQFAIQLENLKKLISLSIPSNRQLLLRKEVLSLYDCGMINTTEYVAKMKEALECTISYKNAVQIGAKYLTNEELYCIQNITLKINWSSQEMEECVKAIIDYCEKSISSECYLRLYQFLMSAVASHLGNAGEYNMANDINQKILILLLKNRRLGGLHEALYELLWNKEQQTVVKKVDHNAIEKEIGRCIKLGKLTRNISRTKIYQEKKERMQNKTPNQETCDTP